MMLRVLLLGSVFAKLVAAQRCFSSVCMRVLH
jgi:hypothetical protein